MLLPNHFNLTITVPDELSLFKYNYSRVRAIVAEEYATLPDVNQLNIIRFVTLSGSVAGYVALILIVLNVNVLQSYMNVKLSPH